MTLVSISQENARNAKAFTRQLALMHHSLIAAVWGEVVASDAAAELLWA